MSRSDAWKQLERDVATALGGFRILRGADFSEDAPDVSVEGFPELKVDAKYRKAHSHHTFMAEIQRKYCLEGDVPVLVSKHHRQKGAYATVPLEYLGKLLESERALKSYIQKCMDDLGKTG